MLNAGLLARCPCTGLAPVGDGYSEVQRGYADGAPMARYGSVGQAAAATDDFWDTTGGQFLKALPFAVIPAMAGAALGGYAGGRAHAPSGAAIGAMLATTATLGSYFLLRKDTKPAAAATPA